MDISFSTIETSRDVVQNYLIMSTSIALVIWYIQLLWKRRYLYIYSWNIEGPFAFPIIGCIYLFLGDGSDLMLRLIKRLQNMNTELGRIWMGPELLYFICKPEHIDRLLNHPKALNKTFVYKFFTEGFGFGLLTAPVNKWKKQRKLLAPAFNLRILDSFAEGIAEKSAVFVDEFKGMDGQKYIDLEELALRYTMDVISHTQMGVDMRIQEENLLTKSTFEKILDGVTYRTTKVWLHPNLIWYFTKSKAKFDAGIKALQDIANSIVKKKMAEQNEQLNLKQPHLEAEIEEVPTYNPLALLELMLNAKITDTELMEQVNVFLAAGTDTTATAICCIFVMMGMHPEVQQKVYEEVIDILGPDRMAETSDLKKMQYTERVIKESLRLFPVVPVFARAIEAHIDLGDAILPAGSSIVICTTHLHRSPMYWTDPLKFDPDRFLSEEVAKRHPCSYIPFSYGPRNCIGWKFAVRILKGTLATAIRKYRIFTEYKSVEEIQMKISLVLKLTDGPKVWLEKR